MADHGRRPDPAGVLRLRQQATLATRGVKEVHPLADLTADWRGRADKVLGTDSSLWAGTVRVATGHGLGQASGSGVALAVSTTPPEPLDQTIDDAATAALATLSRKRSTWTPWNVQAEASRALRAVRFDTAKARDAATERVVAEVAARSVLLTPAEVSSTPADLRRSDGSSAFRPTNAQRYTSQGLLDAESRLLAAGRDAQGPTVAVARPSGAGLSEDQAAAVTAVAGSGRMLDVLVGPAGSGKTRTLAELRTQWETAHGPGSVVGLAPSAAAADVLATSLAISCENTAKWLTEHDQEPDRLRNCARLRSAAIAAPDPATARSLVAALRGATAELERWRFRPGQLVVIDEASLAATMDLDRIAACAAEAGAKLLLVGDWAQLSSVDAGGAFGLLVRDRGTDAPELGAARRFTHAWERAASTRLRVGDPGSLDDYAANGRIHDGDQADMVEAAWNGWTADEHAGLRSLLIAADRSTVHELNERARAERVASGHVSVGGVVLHDGLTAGVGDRIVTRRNDRRLSTGGGWVKNGDTWVVTGCTDHGGLAVQRPGGGPTVRLPSAYVSEHVELGYATTAHRAQGATVDTAHAVVAGPGTTREVLYVMLTRAREANHVYVATDRDVEPLTGFTDEPPTGRGVLLAALANPGAAVSAHEAADDEHETASSIRTLAAEYETLASIAQAPRWSAAFTEAGLQPSMVTEIEQSPAYGALSSALRRADAHGLPVEGALRRLATGIDLGSHDPAAVLHARVEAWISASIRTGRARPLDAVAEILPAARGNLAGDFAAALEERGRHMSDRIDQLIARAELAGAPWLAALGPAPEDASALPSWDSARRAVAAYRDRYGVTDPAPLGAEEPGDLQRAAARRLCADAMAVVRPEQAPGGGRTHRPLSTDSIARPSGAPVTPAR